MKERSLRRPDLARELFRRDERETSFRNYILALR